MTVVEAFHEARVTAIIRTASADVAAKAMDAAVRGGIRIVEITWTTPGAAELVREFARRPELVVGAGTILTTEHVDTALAANVTPMPGCATPTEMWRAYERGAPMQKRFPMGGGPAEVKAILAPMPFLKIVPTNGVELSNVAAYLDAGAWACGLVASLFPADVLARGDWAAIEANARALVAAAATARTRS